MNTIKSPESEAPNLELIEAHLDPFFGEAKTVYHEFLSDLVHVDVLVFPPARSRPYWVYVTSGMGDIRMTLDPGLEPNELSRAELMLALPDKWGKRLSKQGAIGVDDDPENLGWPIDLLKLLARYPHAAGTWLGHGHTIPLNDEDSGGLGNDFCCAMITYSTLLPPESTAFVLPDGDELNFYGVTLLHQREMEFKLRHGFGELAEKLDDLGVSEVVDLERPSAV